MSSNDVPCPGESETASEAPGRPEPETSTANDIPAEAAGPNTDQGTTKPPASGSCENESSESTKGGGKINEKEEQSVFKFSSGKNKGRLARGRRGKKYRKMVLDKDAVQRAAGDESGDSELSDGLVLDWPEDEDEGTKAKSEEESALPVRGDISRLEIKFSFPIITVMVIAVVGGYALPRRRWWWWCLIAMMMMMMMPDELAVVILMMVVIWW